MSKNRLTEIPPEVCLFAPLESLNLYHNCIKCIPEAIINLQMLTYLNISRNLLSTLPKYLFNLPLKVLVVSNNKLLADLPLIRLDFSCNKITEIPPVYRRLRQLQHIILDNNPMQSPPAQICLKGKVHIFNMEDFYPSKNHGPDSGIGSDNGDKRLSATEPSDDDTISLHSQVSDTARADAISLLSKMDSGKDQVPYDFIEPNPEEDAALSEGDRQQSGPYISCIKELEKVLNKSHQSKDKENWKEESGSDKDQLVEEDEDELKEVLDLRKIAVQLLQQEQQNSASLDEGSSGASVLSGQNPDFTDDDTAFSEPSSSCSFDGSLKSESDTEPKWPEVPPVLNQNEERRRNKYLRKDYLKYKCQSARRNSSGNDECEEVMRNADFSTTLTVFGLKPRSSFCRSSRQESSDPSFTMRRKMEHLREEMEQIGVLRQVRTLRKHQMTNND
ncbi:unnamed protein product, partial [Coregonus sp. 'balchen']